MSEYDNDELEAIQTVVNHVSAYQDGATQQTVEEELRKGFDEVGSRSSAATSRRSPRRSTKKTATCPPPTCWAPTPLANG